MLHSGFATAAAKRSLEALQAHLKERWPNIAAKYYPDDHVFVGIAQTGSQEVIAHAKWKAVSELPQYVEQKMFDELNIQFHVIRALLVGAGHVSFAEGNLLGVASTLNEVRKKTA